MTIGEKIKKIRQRRKMTQVQLASAMNLDDGNIRKYEANKRQQRPDMINRFATALEVAPEALTASNIDAIKAMHTLFTIYELYGGKFTDNDGDISISFDALKPFIIEWYKKHQSIDCDSNEYKDWLDCYPQSSELPAEYIELMKHIDKQTDSIDSKNEMP